MMFPVIQSPCVFEPLPSLNMFGFEQPVVAPVPKRRRGLGRSSGQCVRYMPSKASASLRYTVEESPEGYTLSLWKKVPEGMVASAVDTQIAKLKEDSYRPNYHLVRDMWGNSYFVEEEADEEELLRNALSKLNMKAVNRKVSRSLFQEYEIDLNHRGDELTVSSRRDGVSKAFEIGCQIDDVKVVGCKLNESLEYGVLQIALVKSDDCKGQTSDLAKLIQWTQGQSAEESEKEEDCEMASAAAAEAERNARREAEIKAQIEAQIAAKLEAEMEARKAEEQQRAREEERRERIAQENERRQRIAQENERRERIAQENERRQRIAREEQQRHDREEAKRLKEQELKEKKAFLIEQKRAQRLIAEQKKSPSPNTVTININFGNGDNGCDDYESGSCGLKRYQSPILEDVEDAEVERFNKSLSKSPQGSRILEEI